MKYYRKRILEMPTSCPFYESVIQKSELPRDVGYVYNINSHEKLSTDDLEIFHRMFGRNIIKRHFNRLNGIIKNIDELLYLKYMLKNPLDINILEQNEEKIQFEIGMRDFDRVFNILKKNDYDR